ncbi:hypothetical protein V2O64_00640 [Verrucomicrobiaceae bacterium 227]
MPSSAPVFHRKVPTVESAGTKRAMLKRIFLAGLVAPGVFGASGLILTKVVRLGDPGNSREVGIALWQLESFVDGIIAEEGARPKDERVNRAIESAFQSEQQEEPLDPPLSRLVGEILKDPRLGSLGSPPVFAEKNDLPNGFGFYWKGEDGLSRSGGMDPDDINSWNPESARFYLNRARRTAMLQYAGLAMLPAFVVFALLVRMTGRRSFRERLAWLIKKGLTWSSAKYESGYLYFKSFKH